MNYSVDNKDSVQWENWLFVRQEGWVEPLFVDKKARLDIQSIAQFYKISKDNLLQILGDVFEKAEAYQEWRTIPDNVIISTEVKTKMSELLDKIEWKELSFEEFSTKLKAHFNEQVKIVTEEAEQNAVTEEQIRVKLSSAELVAIFTKDENNEVEETENTEKLSA